MQGRPVHDADLEALLLSDLVVLGVAIEGEMLEQLASIELLQEDMQGMGDDAQLHDMEVELEEMQMAWQAVNACALWSCACLGVDSLTTRLLRFDSCESTGEVGARKQDGRTQD